MFSICIMGYGIELSMDIRNPSNMVSLETHHRQLATNNRCEMQYFTHEMEGKGKQIKRSMSVQVVTFGDDAFDSMLAFIRTIRNQRTNHIDCIYRDDGACKLLYASARYLRTTEKEFARNYKREKKLNHTHRPLVPPDEEAIYKALHRNCHPKKIDL